MEKYVAILALVAVVTGHPLNGTLEMVDLRMDGRIVGGKEATIYEVPYQISLQRDGKHYCGGTIIGSNWVLTAGHCLAFSMSSMSIRSGSANANSGGAVNRVLQVIKHEDYGVDYDGIPFNDVALLRIEGSFQFDNSRKPASLFQENSASLTGQPALITGWGETEKEIPTVLHKVTVPIVSRQKCEKAYKSYGGLSQGQICAGAAAGGKDSCQGDSGGPLFVNGQLAGIVSWGIGCGSAKYPGVYTDVSYYRQWIRQKSGV